MIWGIDLGVRSAYLSGLNPESGAWLMAEVTVPQRPVRSLELGALVTRVGEHVREEDEVFIECPPMAGSRNIGTFGALNQVLGALLGRIGGTPVNVMQWKQAVVGKGNASKDEVRAWLEVHNHQAWFLSAGDQNSVDAACIALYGEMLISRADAL